MSTNHTEEYAFVTLWSNNQTSTLSLSLKSISIMQKISFILFFSFFILACDKEPEVAGKRPLGHEYAGLWKTDSVVINGINATSNINALIWIELDSSLFKSGVVNNYTFRGVYEDTELNQYGYTTSEKTMSDIQFIEIKASNPWDPSTLVLEFYQNYDEDSGSSEGGSITKTKTIKGLPIKSRTQNMLSVEVEIDSIKRFYRFVRQ